MQTFFWLEDFNDPPSDPPAEAVSYEEPAEPEPPPPDPRLEGWNEGFMAACRMVENNKSDGERGLSTELIRRLEEIEAQLETVAQNAAGIMGGLLIDMLLEALPPDFPKPAADRVQAVVEAVRPVFELDPRLQVPGDPPGELSFRDMPAFYQALRAGFGADAPLALRWHAPNPVREQLPGLAAALADAVLPPEA